MIKTKNLITLSDLYCPSKNLSEARVSTLIFNHGARLKNIRNGSDVTIRSFNLGLQWFSDNWPDDLDWPKDIERPTPKKEAA